MEEGFEADIEVELMLIAIEQGELIDEDGAQSKALGVAQPFGRDRAMDAEDALEMLVEVLHGQRAEFVEDTTNLDTTIGMGIRPTTGGDQDVVLLITELPEFRIVVVDITQDIADLGREFTDEGGSLLVVGPIGRSEGGGQGDPDRGNDGGDVEASAAARSTRSRGKSTGECRN